MKNPYLNYARQVVRIQAKAATLPLGGLPPLRKPKPRKSAGTALIFSPHPDDECIIGGLALRLLRQARMQVHNVAVTQGSNRERQMPRLEELRAACTYLGFGLIQTAERGLEGINVKARAAQPENWHAAVARVVAILRETRPAVILSPHERDWNSTHIGTHHLVIEALRQMPPDFTTSLVETEFWGAMDAPNLMVEITEKDLADLMAALSFHVGEVQRNPYHVRLPAWMQDNVRRGGELVGGQGGHVPDFKFATLYRVLRWNNGTLTPYWTGGKFLGANEDPLSLFKE